MKKQNLVRTIHVGLYAPHERIIQQAEDAGHNVSETIRALIIKFGKEEFPPIPAYAEALKVSADLRRAKLEGELAMRNMPNEEYATEILHGALRGNKVGFRIANGQELYIPLSDIKNHSVENNGFVNIHNSLYNRTFIWPGGRELSENDWENIFMGWDDPEWTNEKRKAPKQVEVEL